MQLTSLKTIHKLLAKIFFVALPTLAMFYYLLRYGNAAFEIPTTTLIWQTIYFGVGCIGAILFYALGFRFIPTFLILVIGLYSLYRGIDAAATGEFDGFFLTIQFVVFAVLLAIGWLIGWGILRVRKFGFILAVIYLIFYIFLLGQDDIWLQPYSTEQIAMLLLNDFAPVIALSIIVIYFSELIHHLETTAPRFWIALAKRSVVLLVLLGALLWGVSKNKYLNFESKLAKLSQEQSGQGENSLLQKQPDTTDENGEPQEGGYALNKKLSLSGTNTKFNILMFAAHIDNYFEGTQVPNPLYLVSFYYTKYNPETEAFEIDTLTPDKDHFSPDMASIPLYHIQEDTNVLRHSKHHDYIEEVNFEVYNKNLDPNFFVGPTTSYFTQPISIEPSFRKEFRNAYRGKSKSSKLNSAYFVYNAEGKEIQAFQSMRSKILASYQDYSKMDTAFMNYYTNVPNNQIYKTIDSLAKQVTKNSTTTIDKVEAIKNFFLKRDKNGQRIFQYSDNPGEPNLPGASKLGYFLFESKKGYCAYYAAATLYMLRALGIPSRVVGGFLTEDRSSNKNTGWYWYYSDQAHAWVQVYFPGVGWIDFDTTVGNDDARESPQADGTPPLQPAKANFASFGSFVSIDTSRKTGVFKMTSMIVFDRPINIAPTEVKVALSLTKVYKDTASLALSALVPGAPVTLVSYAAVFQKLKNVATQNIINALPQPLPIDEAHLMPQASDKTSTTTNSTPPKFDYKRALGFILLFAILGLLAWWSIPYLSYKIGKRALKRADGTKTILLSYKVLRRVLVLFADKKYATDAALFAAADNRWGTNTQTILNAFHAYKYGGVRHQNPSELKELVQGNAQQILNSFSNIQRFKRWIKTSSIF